MTHKHKRDGRGYYEDSEVPGWWGPRPTVSVYMSDFGSYYYKLIYKGQEVDQGGGNSKHRYALDAGYRAQLRFMREYVRTHNMCPEMICVQCKKPIVKSDPGQKTACGQWVHKGNCHFVHNRTCDLNPCITFHYNENDHPDTQKSVTE